MTTKSFEVPEGMPLAVWRDKYARRKQTGAGADGKPIFRWQTWAERVEEVVAGSYSLLPKPRSAWDRRTKAEHARTLELARAGVLSFAGRHLQHGDAEQSKKLGDVFVNCTSAPFSFVQFYLLLKGCGVSRVYDADACLVDYDHAPNCRFVLAGPNGKANGGHPDWEPWIEDAREARHKYPTESADVRWFDVEDSAEGWAEVVEVIETAAYGRRHGDSLFVFDFSGVRPRGSPIRGQQGRPSSGPVPMIRALSQAMTCKRSGMAPWKQALWIDHYLSACVSVGGSRRSARLAAKWWKDGSLGDVLDFIDAKRGGWLYTANNSLLVDAEFWEQARDPRPSRGRRIFEEACRAAYWDGTGEPGFVNVDRLDWNAGKADTITAENVLGPTARKALRIHPQTDVMMDGILRAIRKKKWQCTVNPCSEIVVPAWGGYCSLTSGNLAASEDVDVLVDAARLGVQFLVRANLMRFVYEAEVKRSNRIGFSFIGWHELAWKKFGFRFRDLLDEPKAKPFWDLVDLLRRTTDEEAAEYAERLGVPVPHGIRTIPPSGTTAKVLDVCAGAHLPSYAHMIRWNQYPISTAEQRGVVASFEAKGHPVKDVSHFYPGHVVVGFPRQSSLWPIMGEAVTVRSECTVEEQIRWVRLLEKHWLGPLGTGGQQVSMTIAYDASKTSWQEYLELVLEHVPTVRCCAFEPWTPQEELLSAYPYVPEERITAAEYETLSARIAGRDTKPQERDLSDCTHGCPLDPSLHASGEAVAERTSAP